MSFIGLGVAIGNVAGAIAGSVGAGLSALGATGLGTAIGGVTSAGTVAGAGGLGSLLGATAAGTAGSALAGTAGTGLGETATALGIGGAESSAAPAAVAAPATTTGNAAMDVMFGQAPTAAPASAPTTLTEGGMTGFGHLGDTAATNVASQGVQGVNQQIANAKTQQGETDYLNSLAQQDLAGRQAAKSLYGPPSSGIGGKGWAEGGIATIQAARGGSVRLKNGDYIVPADVVSALGNGSTKAGAKYLTHLCNALHAGPPSKAGSLAKQRAKARHTA